ncbi:MAG TPA: hypothetical protein VIK45_17275 [Candidatus Dormibacteraeota bacterium]
MTAITTVPSHLRLARVTPYLLAAAAALAAWLLLGAHTAFAAEKAGSAHSRPHAAEAVEPAPSTHRGDPAATERAVQKPVDRRVAQASEPGDDHRSGGRKTLYHPAADAAPAPRQVEASTAPPPTHTAPAGTTLHRRGAEMPAAPTNHRHLQQSPRSGEGLPSNEGETSDAGPAQQPPALSTPASMQVAARPMAVTPAGHRAGTSPDRPATQRRHAAAAPYRLTDIKLVAQPAQAQDAQPAQAAPPAQVAQPAQAAQPAPPAAPAQDVNPPVAIAVPQPLGSHPARSGPVSGSSGSLPAILSGALLGLGPQSALSLIALGLLIPLLAFVLFFQIRLLRLMRGLKLSAPPPPALPRYLSLTHEEVRQLVPDLAPALAHHRFCESVRHEGRHRLANWLELEELEAELPHMWATCETCHHQRMTHLTANGGVSAVSN